MKLELDKRFKNKAKGRFGRYSFEVGVLQDVPYKKPVHKNYTKATKRKKKNSNITIHRTITAFKSFHGGPARRTSNEIKGTVRKVSKHNRRRTDYLRRPFLNREGNVRKDVQRFMSSFLALVRGRGNDKRIVNALQAIVRNPILRGDYGPNDRKTVRIKGFDRYMIDTGQLFNNIKARVKKRRFF